MSKQSLVLIHGAWVNGRCWEPVKQSLEQAGYQCAAPHWPHKDKPNDAALANVGITEILEHYKRIIRQYDTPPVLIGHSFGGLFTQLLLNQGYGAAGVLLNSAPTKELLPLYASVWQTNFPVVKQFLFNSLMQLTLSEFSFSFLHHSPATEQRELYQQVLPETPRIFRQALSAPFHNLTKIDYSVPPKPMLFLAGENDLLCPARQNNVNAEHYHSTNVQYQVVPKGNHGMLFQAATYPIVTEKILAWLTNIT